MIYYDIHYPEQLTGKELDDYLANGWYRMQQMIFTTDVILKENRLLPVFWLRLAVEKYSSGKKHQQLIALNNKYIVDCGDAVITGELEQLYQLYKAAMNFELADSLQDSLLGAATTSIYHTQCYTIQDEGKLIAAGFFDKGEKSIAGILNIYHPDYARQQLGKYLVLLKIAFAQQQQLDYYYTGYMSTADSKFDYKLFAGKEATEVYYRKQQQWVPWLSVQKERLEDWLIREEIDQETNLPSHNEL
jgi:leucyl-tRNA---protein transferase